jgi:hypothetical protein
MVGKVAVRLKLPPVWHRVHSVFHVSLVKKYYPDAKVAYFPPPVVVGDAGEVEYEVEAILSHRGGKKRRREYLVSWKGFGADHNEWLPERDLVHCQRLLRAYQRQAGLHVRGADTDGGAGGV